MDRIKNRLREERVDISQPIRSMSYNMPSHEERMVEHCERVEREYFTSGLQHKDMHGSQVGK